MGLSIHYSGRIKDVELIPVLVEEVRDVCSSFGWTHHLFNDENFQGICFSPPECEPVFLTFTNSTELACPIRWQYKIEPVNVISTKTQYAGMDVHIALLKLLKYLKEKYFAVFDLDDEGGYWGKWDEAILQRQFDRYNFLVNAVADALRDFKSAPGESPQSLTDRLQNFLEEQQDDFKANEREE